MLALNKPNKYRPYGFIILSSLVLCLQIISLISLFIVLSPRTVAYITVEKKEKVKEVRWASVSASVSSR